MDDNSFMAEIISGRKAPSVMWGTMIISGTIIGAGMFSLPIVMSGAWFSWSTLILLFSWFCMLLSGLLYLESSQHYPEGANFSTVTRDLLGSKWNVINGITIAFVLGILTYAYISASGSILHHTFASALPWLSQRMAGFLFTLLLAVFIWLGTAVVSRMTFIFLFAKLAAFLLTFGGLLWHVQVDNLLNTQQSGASYFPYIFMVLPFCLASFGYHGNISGLVSYYRQDAAKVRKCLIYGTLIALAIYFVWLISAMGNIQRAKFIDIAQAGGNIDALVATFGDLISSPWLSVLLLLFSNFAVASSFLGVSLGLFDYLADLFGMANNAVGRLKTTLMTFAVPLTASLIYPNGFLHAIGYAGLAATLWAVITPALLAFKARQRFGPAAYRVAGGHLTIMLVLLFGGINIVVSLLSYADLLPVYAR